MRRVRRPRVKADSAVGVAVAVVVEVAAADNAGKE
jgi:hypothetical protein